MGALSQMRTVSRGVYHTNKKNINIFTKMKLAAGLEILNKWIQ